MKKLLFLVLLLSVGFASAQQKMTWQQKSQPKSAIKQVWPRTVSKGDLFFALDVVAMRQTLANAKDKLSNQPGVVVSFPNTNGSMETYSVWENSNFAPELQAKYPNIRSYVGKGITDKSASINFSVSPLGIETMVLRANGSEFIESYDRAATTYVLFDRKNHTAEKHEWKCSTKDNGMPSTALPQNNQNRSNAGQYKTLRLAMPCNGEYAQYFGGTKALALAGMNASMTRINAVFEADLDVHMNFIANEDDLIFTNSETDPFSPGSIGANNSVWNHEVQDVISTTIGNAGYDIGHGFFMTGGGGASGGFAIYCVDDNVNDLTDFSKGSGFTSPESDTAAPTGDVFEFDFAAHEFGHQFGANHTFSYAYEGSPVQVEPGSGCTIMAYAGVTGPYDVQPHNLKHFSFASIQQMQAVLATKTCPVSITNSNNTPTVNAGNDYTIPKGTAFILTASGSDADSTDALTYSWEQSDNAPQSATDTGSVVSDQKTEGPNFVVKEPTTSPIRYMPKLSSVLAGELTTPSNWESVSNVARSLNFNVTVRDNHPGMGETNVDGMLITVSAASGPFTVTSQNTNGISWNAGSTQTITWDVNNTNVLAGSTNVNVTLSTDGGLTFPTVLGSNVPNNGSLSFTVPNVDSATCRIMVKPTANIYFAVNSNEFAIVPSYTITATSGANGTVSPTAVTTVVSGANQSYTITPNNCYAIADVIVDGVSQGALTTYTFSNVTANHTINATFSSSATTTGSLTTSACNTYTWAQNGQTYTASGTYTNVVGCNTATLTLTINNSTTNGSLSATANNTYTWSAPLGNGQTYTASGTYTSVTTNAAGCPNTATLTLTINIVAGTNWYQDTDGDGFGNPAVSINAPTAPVGYVANNTDCNDASASQNPNASEILGNGTDDNCDGTTDEVTPLSSLIATSCGVTLTNLSNTLFAYPLSNFQTQTGPIQGYRFRVTNGATVRTLDSSTNSFALTSLVGGAAYATTYTIEVSVKHGGFYRAYGSSCTVTTPTVPNTTGISTPSCGSTMSDINATIFCTQVPSASGYRFRVRNGATLLGTVDTTVNRFSLTSIAGYQFGTTYTVDVLLAFSGVYRPDAEYGPACSITTPATPGTSRVIQPTCGSSISSFWTTIFAQQVQGAQGYKFVVTDGAQTREYATPNSRFTLRNLGTVLASTTYTIRVDVLYNLSYVQGTVLCTISTTAGASRQTSSALDIYEVKAYPNPYADTFKLDVNTSSEDQVGVRVYDMLGREVESREVSVDNITNLEIGSHYPSGVYNVIVTQGDNVKTHRVIKR